MTSIAGLVNVTDPVSNHFLPVNPDPKLYSLDQIVHISSSIQQGAVFAYPTEGVWGLGAAIDQLVAVERILTIKQRPVEKGLIIVCADLDQLETLLEPLTAEQKSLVSAQYEQATTWILPCKSEVNELIRGQHLSIAVRLSQHPLVKKLCQTAGPLISTSANPAGLDPAMSAQQVADYFPTELDFIVQGELGGAEGSSQIRTLGGKILR